MVVALLAASALLMLAGVARFTLAAYDYTQRRLHAAYRAHVILSEAKRCAAKISAGEAQQAQLRG